MSVLDQSNTAPVRLDAGPSGGQSRAVAQVSMTTSEKQRLTRLAKEHGLSLSAFLRMAANDYIQRNDWE